MRTAIIVTTYNRPDALDRVLASLAAMTVRADEIVIADDGSGEETNRVVQSWQKRLPLSHVWQADEGFRAAEIRNKAVLDSTAEYLVFLDGDCIVPLDFIQQHQRLAESGFMVAGNRILFSHALTSNVVHGLTDPQSWTKAYWLFQKLNRHINRLLPLLSLPDGMWRKKRPYRWQGIHTCNLGIWRKDFEAVNGFDQSFQGWGHEDADLAIRLMRYGVLRKEGACAIPVFHLWHPENERSSEADNRLRLMDVIAGKYPMRCRTGLVNDA